MLSDVKREMVFWCRPIFAISDDELSQVIAESSCPWVYLGRLPKINKNTPNPVLILIVDPLKIKNNLKRMVVSCALSFVL